MTKRIEFFDGFTSETTPNTVVVSAGGIIGAWQGAWVSQNYVADDAVYFEGSSYICILDTVSNDDPTNATYWELVALKGENIEPDESADFDEAKVSTIEALPNISTLDRYFILVQSDTRSNQALPAEISGDQSLHLLAWDGALWSDLGQYTGDKGDIGATGATGPQGPQGLQGNQGEGLEAGGTAGQLLIKNSGTDFDVSWTDTITGNKTFSNDITITGDLTVNGTTTTVNTSTLDVTDSNITVNNTGDQATADTNDAGLTVEMSDATDAIIGYDSTTSSKFNIGEVGATQEIATTAHTQTLTNKTIDGDNNTISNLAHGAEVDNPTSGVHGVTGTLVGTSDTQTLTNKTMDADLNTISNLAHGAEVDDPSSGVHGVTGSVVGTTDTQTLTNKDFDGGTASNTNRMTIPKDTTANLDLLTDKEATLAYDTTLSAPVYNDGAAWNAFAGGGGGGTGDSWSFVSSVTISNDASVAFTNMEDGYDYRYRIEGLVPVTDNSDPWAELGVAGPTYRTSDYRMACNYITSAGGNVTNSTTAFIRLDSFSGLGATSDEQMFCILDLFNPANASFQTMIKYEGAHENASAQHVSARGWGWYDTDESHVAIRFRSSSGNLSSGTIYQYRRAIAFS